jgi:hypothetical protein
MSVLTWRKFYTVDAKVHERPINVGQSPWTNSAVPVVPFTDADGVISCRTDEIAVAALAQERVGASRTLFHGKTAAVSNIARFVDCIKFWLLAWRTAMRAGKMPIKLAVESLHQGCLGRLGLPLPSSRTRWFNTAPSSV